MPEHHELLSAGMYVTRVVARGSIDFGVGAQVQTIMSFFGPLAWLMQGMAVDDTKQQLIYLYKGNRHVSSVNE